MTSPRSDRKPTEFDGIASKGVPPSRGYETSTASKLSSIALALFPVLVLTPAIYALYVWSNAKIQSLEDSLSEAHLELEQTRVIAESTQDQVNLSSLSDNTYWVKIGEIYEPDFTAKFSNLTSTSQISLEKKTEGLNWSNCGEHFVSFDESPDTFIASESLNVREAPYSPPDAKTKLHFPLPVRASIEVIEIACERQWIWARINIDDN